MPAKGDYGVLVPSMTTEIEFVLNPISKFQTKQQRDLRISQVKSHAARASHRSRQLPKVWSQPVQRTAPGARKRIKAPSLASPPRAERKPRRNSYPSTSADGSTKRVGLYADFLMQRERNHFPNRPLSAAATPAITQWQWTGGGTRHDPFAMMPGLDCANDDDAFAFDWFCQYVSMGVASICQPFGASNLYGRWLFEQMALHPDVFHIIMAALHGGLAAVGRSHASHVSHRLRHMGLSMHSLQKRLSAADPWANDDAILTMV
jgi:hypothetical protein